MQKAALIRIITVRAAIGTTPGVRAAIGATPGVVNGCVNRTHRCDGRLSTLVN